MELIQTEGIVLKTTPYKDNDMILTLLTDRLGKIQVAAKGIKSYKNKLSAGCRIFTFSEFQLVTGRELYRLKDCSLRHSFYNLSTNIERLAFATYLSDLTAYVTEAQEPDPGLIRLVLNTFHLLAHSRRDLRLIRAVFELKLLQYTGLAPQMDCCIQCGDTNHVDFFDPIRGGLVCSGCQTADALPLPEPCLIAMRYVLYHTDKKIFAFTLTDRYVAELERLLERFMRVHIDKEFASLTYLKHILGE